MGLAGRLPAIAHDAVLRSRAESSRGPRDGVVAGAVAAGGHCLGRFVCCSGVRFGKGVFPFQSAEPETPRAVERIKAQFQPVVYVAWNMDALRWLRHFGLPQHEPVAGDLFEWSRAWARTAWCDDSGEETGGDGDSLCSGCAWCDASGEETGGDVDSECSENKTKKMGTKRGHEEIENGAWSRWARAIRPRAPCRTRQARLKRVRRRPSATR